MTKYFRPFVAFCRAHFVAMSFAFAAAAALAFTGCASMIGESGFVSIFDGKTLNGWTYLGEPGGEYFVTNGVIVCPKVSKGNLVTDKEYSDFILRLEYKYEPDGNNGVCIRAPMTHENLTYVGVEIQMLDNTAPMHRNLHAWQYNGSVYGIVASSNSDGIIGAWNKE